MSGGGEEEGKDGEGGQRGEGKAFPRMDKKGKGEERQKSGWKDERNLKESR